MPIFYTDSGSIKDLGIPTGSLSITSGTLSVISSSIYFNNLITSSTTITNVLMVSSSGQVFITASSAIGGGGTGTGTVTGTGTQGYISYWSGSSTNLSSSILYQNANKVGIGITSPSASLDITSISSTPTLLISGLGNGDSRTNLITITGSGGRVFNIDSSGTATSMSLKMNGTGNTSTWDFITTTGTNLNGGSNNNYIITKEYADLVLSQYSALNIKQTGATNINPIVLKVSDGDNNTRLIISSSNIGIGTSTPAYSLDVSGSGNFTNNLTVTGSFTVTSGSTEFRVLDTGIKIGNSGSDSHQITGSLSIASGSLNVYNTLYVSGSNVGIGTRTPTGSLDVTDQITIHSGPSAAAKWAYYTVGNVPWSIQSPVTTNRLAFYSSTPSLTPTKIIDLSDYVDSSPPNLVLGGGNNATGFPNYWGIGTDMGINYSSSFAVKQYLSVPYAIVAVDSNDKIAAGIKPNGDGYFSGSVGIGTTSSLNWNLDVLGNTGRFRVGNGNFTDVFFARVGSGNQGYSDVFLNAQSYGLVLYANPQNTGYIVSNNPNGDSGTHYSTGSAGIIAQGNSAPLVLGAYNEERMRIHTTGDISIGLQANNIIGSGYRLNVTGSGVSGSFKVNNVMITSGSHIILPQVSSSLNFANDTAAAAGGVPLGGLYRNGNAIQIRLA